MNCDGDQGQCRICGVELSDERDSEHYDCGGDCLTCMANLVGDPDCVDRLKEIREGSE